MNLSRANLNNIERKPGIIFPDESVFSLPEKVLQFGTGVLLRGLPDYFIDKANRLGSFNGRIVVIKSTSSGDTNSFAEQDGLYTICVKGIENGVTVEERIINSSISRVLTAKEEWQAVLECARNENIKLIISNTTEVGITYLEEKISRNEAPVSFPAKLLAVLHERFVYFKGSRESGMVIIPTELITENGAKLRSIILKLAEHNKYSREFTDWLLYSNDFCDSLVDRIVPGRLPDTERVKEEVHLRYSDDLMIMTESFRLWAIQSASPKVKAVLSFADADHGVVIASDIEKFRELKLRLLNGTHSFTCGLAFLAGFSTVREAMNNEHILSFVKAVMHEEIIPAIVDDDIHESEAKVFAEKVVDRFCNPYLEHKWSGIAVQYSSKMKMRNIPLIIGYNQRTASVPSLMALGFAAFLIYMRSYKSEHNFIGHANGINYTISDDSASYFSDAWRDNDIERAVDNIVNDSEFWEMQLGEVKGFSAEVKDFIRKILNHGVLQTLASRKIENVKM